MRIAPAQPTRSVRQQPAARGGDAREPAAAEQPARTVAVIRKSDPAADTARVPQNASNLSYKDAALATPGPVATAMSPLLPSTAAAAATRLELPAELLDSMPELVGDFLKVLRDSLNLDAVPVPGELKTPEAVVARYIGERGPAAKVARKAELEAQVQRFSGAVLALEGSGDEHADTIADLRAKLAATEAQLAKATKDSPTTVHELKALQEAKSTYEVAVQARHDAQAKGCAKAAERGAERHALLGKLKAQVAALEVGVTAVEADNAAKHAAKKATADSLDCKVIELFDTKIRELKAVAPAPPAADGARAGLGYALPPGPVPAGEAGTLALLQAAQVPVVQDSVPTTLQELAKAKEDIRLLQEKLEAGATNLLRDFGKTFDDVRPEMLPQQQAPKKEEVGFYGALYETLAKWNATGAVAPFDWQALQTDATGDPGPIVLYKVLVGDIWKRWYAADPAAHDVVPRQLSALAFQALCAIKIEYESQEAAAIARKQAEVSYGAVRDSAKRLRVQR